jgi:hypothetical protein
MLLCIEYIVYRIRHPVFCIHIKFVFGGSSQIILFIAAGILVRKIIEPTRVSPPTLFETRSFTWLHSSSSKRL